MLSKIQTKLGRSFVRLNLTQFLGALNDNLFKLILIFFLIEQHGADAAGEVSAMAGIVFVIPFLVFSPLAGMLADCMPKNRLIQLTKGLECGVMAIACIAFALENALGLYLALFLMAFQSAIFSPAKYGIVPELVSIQDLSRANGFIEAFTYLAIILGTTIATIIPLLTGHNYQVTSLACIVIALAGLLMSFGIKTPSRLPVKSKRRHIRTDIKAVSVIFSQDKFLALSVVGSSLFMLIGAFVQLNLIPYGMQTLGLSQEVSGILFLCVALGIGVGSILAGRLSSRNVELGVIPIGAALIGLTMVMLGFCADEIYAAAFLLSLLGIGAGLFIVPLHAFVQFRAPDRHRGKILATVSFLGWCGVLIAALLTHLVNQSLALSADCGFLGLGGLMLFIALVTIAILPDFCLRFVVITVIRLVYRPQSYGLENVPVEGGALLVANHVSWIDALLLLATQQRRIRFMMERRIYETFLLRHLYRLMKVIPVSAEDSPRVMLSSLNSARQALDEGYLVCIFAEGAITRNGTLQEFRPGFERIVKGTEHLVIPVHLGGVWGSVFSYKNGPIFSRIQLTVPEQVVIHFGTAMSSLTSPAEVRQAVMELSSQYFDLRKSAERSLGKRFVMTARKNWRNLAISDSSGRELTFGQTLVAGILLKKILNKQTEPDERIGLLLPASVGSVLVNISLTMAGRVPVNLNYTASHEILRLVTNEADITMIITSRQFLKHLPDLKIDNDRKVFFVEDLLSTASSGQKAAAWITGRLAPASWIARNRLDGANALATIVFSSGSTAKPKGVMLSQHNILSNIEALSMVFALDQADKLCGILPFFHSFGLTGTLWLPLIQGFSVVYHHSPLDARRIVRLISTRKSTFLLATPTFLSSYMHRASQEDFASLRLVVTGAEKLSTKLASEFNRKFGIALLEGYGATELSPVAAINLPDLVLGKRHQIGTKAKSVGRPLPGVAIKITAIGSDQALPPNREGMIHLRGPNVMLGYLNDPGKTSDVVKDGWYETGDIGCIDSQGFLKITDRLARFSKIAGEMVSHGAIEDTIQDALNGSYRPVAVTSIPDSRRGERLIVLYDGSLTSVKTLKNIIASSALPNLWKPDQNSYLEVQSIPILGSGKFDLQTIKSMALEAFC